MPPIHTVNTRDDLLLELLRDEFGITGARMKREIQLTHAQLIRDLQQKKIAYSELRSALVPSMDRHEAAFIFDSSVIESGLYGREVFDHILPLLDQRTTQSILVGDLLGRDQQLIFEILHESLVLNKSFTFKHATLLYAVYINNLSDAAISRIHEGLKNFDAYLGYILTTYQSRAKIYLSTTLIGFILKKGSTLVLAHEDDRPNSEDINITLYDLEKFGYSIRSLQSYAFSVLLTYKIERPVFDCDKSDISLSLNAISNNPQALSNFTVLLDENKYGYLINKKLGKLKKAGLEAADRKEMEGLIQSQVMQSYIYNLSFLQDHGVMKFNIMLEVNHPSGLPTKMTAALEYIPDSQTLRVITLH